MYNSTITESECSEYIITSGTSNGFHNDTETSKQNLFRPLTDNLGYQQIT